MMKHIGIALVLSALALSACAPDRAPQTTEADPFAYRPSQQAAYQGEDCDFDDILERDEDCGFRKKKKPHTKYVAVPVVTHAPRPAYAPSKPKVVAYKPVTTYKPSPSSYRPSTVSYKPTPSYKPVSTFKPSTSSYKPSIRSSSTYRR